MDNQQRQGPGLPISGAAVVIALIFGSLFVQLGYIKTDRDEDNATEEGLPEIVPYEWFVPGFESKHKLKRKILVLWLDDNAFYPTPLAYSPRQRLLRTSYCSKNVMIAIPPT